MNLIRLLLLLLPIFVRGELNSQVNYKIDTSFPNAFLAPYDQLNMRYGLVPKHDVVPDAIRQGYDPKVPGNYFRIPIGVNPELLDSRAKTGIYNTLKTFIDTSLYDAYIVDNILGYNYRLNYDKIERNEFFIRYVNGDTIYVISGWFGKFTSFFRAVPGDNKYTLGQLLDEIDGISHNLHDVTKNEIRDESKSGIYFYEIVNKSDGFRIRNYIIEERWATKDPSMPLLIKPYNLIEITKFLDKEMMP